MVEYKVKVQVVQVTKSGRRWMRWWVELVDRGLKLVRIFLQPILTSAKKVLATVVVTIILTITIII